MRHGTLVQNRYWYEVRCTKGGGCRWSPGHHVGVGVDEDASAALLVRVGVGDRHWDIGESLGRDVEWTREPVGRSLGRWSLRYDRACVSDSRGTRRWDADGDNC